MKSIKKVMCAPRHKWLVKDIGCKNMTFNNIDKYSLTLKLIIFLTPLLFLFGLIVPYVFGYISYSIYSLYITIPLIFAIVIFYLVRNKKDIIFEFNNKYLYIFDVLYSLIYLISIIILLHYDIRITLYFIFLDCLFIIILIKILFFNDLEYNKYVIMFQIIIFFMNLSYGISLKYPQFIGRGDTIYHSWYIKLLIEGGWNNRTIISSYYRFPLWHLFVSAVSIITKIDTEPYKIMFLLNGIINSSIIIISYYISKFLFIKEKIAYLTSLLLCIYPSFIVNTIQALPRAINGSLIAVVLFLLLKRDYTVFKVLVLFIGLSMILFHHASMISVLVIYSIMFSLQFFYSIKDEDQIIDLRYILIIMLCIMGYWFSYADFLLTDIMASLDISASAVYSSPSGFQIAEMLNFVQYSPYIFFTTISLLALLWYGYYGDRVKILGVVGFGLLALSIPNPLSSVYSRYTTLIFNRLMEYTSVFIIIITSYGLFYVFQKVSKSIKIIFIVFMFLTCILSIDNDFTASDNPLIKRDFYTYYLSNPEISSIETLIKISNNNYLMSDYQIWRFIVHSNYSYKSHLLEVDYNHTVFFKERYMDLIVIRESELQKRSLNLFATNEYIRDPSWVEGRLVYLFYDEQVFDTLNTYNRNYDNGNVVAYN